MAITAKKISKPKKNGALLKPQKDPKKVIAKKSNARKKKEPKRIWDIAKDIFKNVPDDAWKDIPKDLGKYSDYYLYGGKKE